MTTPIDPRWLEVAKETFADCGLIGTSEATHTRLVERFAEALQDAYSAGLRLAEGTLSGILDGRRAGGLSTGEGEICRNAIIRLQEQP